MLRVFFVKGLGQLLGVADRGHGPLPRPREAGVASQRSCQRDVPKSHC
jgi:hypothetical protein